MTSRLLQATAVLLFILPTAASARQQVPTARAETIKGFRGEFVRGAFEVQQKVLALARAIPAEKYSWRPAPGIRSISEVFMHIAGSNYFLTGFLGSQPPAGVPADFEKITQKQAVIAELQRSFDHVRDTARSAADGDLEKTVTLFGSSVTQRVVYVTILNHLHEHLGQAIAYGRMNGVAPPWSGRD
ncbi:MAG TPA: DinB family protein [Thermoanaerobaculia bacterium]|nr:DinB family protein [Thermoanaerobaculia bacterium]